MKFCQRHWNMMREAVKERGLEHLVAPDPSLAMEQLKSEFEQGPSAVNFDPLMQMHWAIISNVTHIVAEAAGSSSVMYLMQGEDVPEDPVSREYYGDAAGDRTWPRCPLCYLSLAHELSCTDSRCALDKVNGYDFFVERAADDAKKEAERIADGRGRSEKGV